MKPIQTKTASFAGIGILFFILLLISCASTKTENCIDESKIDPGACITLYNPVCGCDGKTYGNKCEAGRAGVTSWEPGKCVSSKPKN